MTSDKFSQTLIEFSKDMVWAVLCMWHWFIAALPTIVLILGFIYVLMQIGYLWWKWKNEIKVKKPV